MAIVPMPDPETVPDDEIAQATGHPWWAPITARLLDELDPAPTPDDDPALSPGR